MFVQVDLSVWHIRSEDEVERIQTSDSVVDMWYLGVLR